MHFATQHIDCRVFMNFLTHLLVLNLFLFAADCSAKQVQFKNESEFLASIPDSNANQSRVVKGDLTGDRRSDMAILVVSGEDLSDRTQRLVVLAQDADGLYSLAASSAQTQSVGMGCCWVEWLEIKRGSIFIQNNAKTACNIEAATHQFKLHHGSWRLVGLKIIYLEHCAEPQITTTQDFNLLTGKAIYTNETEGKKTNVRVENGKPSVYLLGEYDFYNGFGIPKT